MWNENKLLVVEKAQNKCYTKDSFLKHDLRERNLFLLLKLGSPPLTLRPQVKCRSLEKDIYSSVKRKNSMGYFLMQQLTHNLKLECCVLAISQHKSWCMNYTSECQWVINLICHSVSYLIAVQWLYGCLYLVVFRFFFFRLQMNVIIVFLLQNVLSILLQLTWVACGWLECWRQGRKEI